MTLEELITEKAGALNGCTSAEHRINTAVLFVAKDLYLKIEVLRSALDECLHQTNSMRTWNGMGWSYHPSQAGRIALISKAALDEVTNA